MSENSTGLTMQVTTLLTTNPRRGRGAKVWGAQTNKHHVFAEVFYEETTMKRHVMAFI